MRHGLPVVTTNIGGPGYIVDDRSGVRVPVVDPQQLATDLATAIRRLASDRSLLDALGEGARARVIEIGLWGPKIDRMVGRYSAIGGEVEKRRSA